jgi:hypothetical protein
LLIFLTNRRAAIPNLRSESLLRHRRDYGGDAGF